MSSKHLVIDCSMLKRYEIPIQTEGDHIFEYENSKDEIVAIKLDTLADIQERQNLLDTINLEIRTWYKGVLQLNDSEIANMTNNEIVSMWSQVHETAKNSINTALAEGNDPSASDVAIVNASPSSFL